MPPSRTYGNRLHPYGRRGRVLAAKIGEAALMAAGMAWQVGWSLILGFALSAAVQALVSKERMQQLLGRDGVREIALATGFGAASSSCSYAAAAMSKTLFKKGAALVPSLAFLFSSTNLVVELGIILWLLMGWQFTAAEWIGGLLLIAIMAVLVKLTYPKQLVEDARRHLDEATGHDHGSMEGEGATVLERLRNPQTRIAIAQNFAMDVSMLWKDLRSALVIAGAGCLRARWRLEDALLMRQRSAVQLVGNAVGPGHRDTGLRLLDRQCRWQQCCGRAESRSAGCSRSCTQT